jgi:hypothetical protein
MLGTAHSKGVRWHKNGAIFASVGGAEGRSGEAMEMATNIPRIYITIEILTGKKNLRVL